MVSLLSWLVSAIPALGKPREEYHELEASLGKTISNKQTNNNPLTAS